ncbi:MAG: Rieske 2Fe-2S domain-containing protein [Actinobacteria bacterium]|nr:Rieske 2Fe-2S domain-containing protein [Actinomycetota bacterium]
MIQNFLRTATHSWRSQVWALRIMRLWLGATWIYAGWDKATDPGFLARGASSFIGTQLSGYSTQSPVGFAFNKLIEHAVPVGIFVMVSEFAIGLATLLWVAPTVAAFGGFSMSMGLWLASSFHANPYFLASDSAYAVLWLSYLLMIRNKRKGFSMSFERRGVLRIGIIAVLATAFAGVGKIFTPAAVQESAAASGKTKLVKLASLKIGATKNFVLANGAPAVLFRTKTGVFAYSAICTHQGCTVNYSASSKTLKCPCHGAEFDPQSSGKPIAGPAINPLAKVKVAVEGAWVILA